MGKLIISVLKYYTDSSLLLTNIETSNTLPFYQGLE